jgi:hypothetical protein
VDATLVAVLITLIADIVAKVRASRAEGKTQVEMKTVIQELKALHEVNTQAIAAVNRRVDQVEARLTFAERGVTPWLSQH